MAKTIMVVDDSEVMRQVVGTTLREAGYDVIEGEDGRDALSKLTGQRVHLVISDLNMPHLDGIGFVRSLKQLPAYRFTPVMMLTTESRDSIKAQGRAAGACAWLLKPFQPEMVLQAVMKLVSL